MNFKTICCVCLAVAWGLAGTVNAAGVYEDNTANYVQWIWVERGTMDVTAGSHEFSLRRLESGYMVDRIVLASAPCKYGCAIKITGLKMNPPTATAQSTARATSSAMTARAGSPRMVTFWKDPSF